MAVSAISGPNKLPCTGRALILAISVVVLGKGAACQPLFFNASFIRLLRTSPGTLFPMQRHLADAVVARASVLVAAPTFSVTHKTAPLSPSADPRLYQSTAPYDWRVRELPTPPPPNVKDKWGKLKQPLRLLEDPEWRSAHAETWLNADGYPAPKTWAEEDSDRFHAMATNVTLFALAYCLSGEERFATKAAAIARRWWVDPTTAMLPNLDLSFLGRPPRHVAMGPIKLHEHWHALDSLALLTQQGGGVCVRDGAQDGTLVWTDGERLAVTKWCAQMASWLQRHPDVHSPHNTHDVIYVVHVMALMRCAGRSDKDIVAFWTSIGPGVLAELPKDGSVPALAARNQALHFNLYMASGLTLWWRALENLGRPEDAQVVARKLVRCMAHMDMAISAVHDEWPPSFSRGAEPLQDLSQTPLAEVQRRWSYLCHWARLAASHFASQLASCRRVVNTVEHSLWGDADVPYGKGLYLAGLVFPTP